MSPPRCRKCQGFVAIEFGEGRCVNCGRTYTRQELAALPADPPPPAAPAPREEEPVMAKTCTSARCEEPAAEDSVLCGRHRDMKRAANERQRAKRLGISKPARAVRHSPPRATPTTDTASAESATAPESSYTAGNGHSGAKTARQIAIDEIDRAIQSLRESRAILAAFPVVE